jgi:hypothetical protein
MFVRIVRNAFSHAARASGVYTNLGFVDSGDAIRKDPLAEILRDFGPATRSVDCFDVCAWTRNDSEVLDAEIGWSVG